MRRSDLVQHKEKEKAPTRVLRRLFLANASTFCACSIRWKAPICRWPALSGAPLARRADSRAHSRTHQINTAWDEKIGLVLSADAKPEMLEKLVKQAPETDYYLLRLISEHPVSNAKLCKSSVAIPTCYPRNVARHPR